MRWWSVMVNTSLLHPPHPSPTPKPLPCTQASLWRFGCKHGWLRWEMLVCTSTTHVSIPALSEVAPRPLQYFFLWNSVLSREIKSLAWVDRILYCMYKQPLLWRRAASTEAKHLLDCTTTQFHLLVFSSAHFYRPLAVQFSCGPVGCIRLGFYKVAASGSRLLVSHLDWRRVCFKYSEASSTLIKPQCFPQGLQFRPVYFSPWTSTSGKMVYFPSPTNLWSWKRWSPIHLLLLEEGTCYMLEGSQGKRITFRY